MCDIIINERPTFEQLHEMANESSKLRDFVVALHDCDDVTQRATDLLGAASRFYWLVRHTCITEE